MILSNYWKWLNACNTLTPEDLNPHDVGIKGLTGANAAIVFANSALSNYLIASGNSVRIGTGSNTYTKDDYALADDITSSFSDVSMIFASNGDDGLSRIITVSGTNAGSTDLTISEIGYVKAIYDYPNAGHGDSVLFAICQLAEPLTVTAGSGFLITINWTEE